VVYIDPPAVRPPFTLNGHGHNADVRMLMPTFTLALTHSITASVHPHFTGGHTRPVTRTIFHIIVEFLYNLSTHILYLHINQEYV